MRESGDGRIINLSSMGGKFTFPGGGAYHGTKYAVEALSDAMRFEVSGFGVKVVLIEPGLITTSFGGQPRSARSMPHPTMGPYGKFNAGVAKSTAEAYAGPMAKARRRSRGRRGEDRDRPDVAQPEAALHGGRRRRRS